VIELKWNVLIVDDEAPAREELAYLLRDIQEIGVVRQTESGIEALWLLKEDDFDILFLDIEMPGLNGLQTAEIIGGFSRRPKIVFCTAYDQYAIEAFKLRAFHYLLKPYDESEIEAIVRELTEERKRTDAHPHAAGSQALPVKLAIEASGRIKYVAPQDIVYICKDGKNVTIYAEGGSFESGLTLSELEQKLAPYSFFRCHKSYLINLRRVSELKAWVNGAYNLMMDDSKMSSIPVSRNYVKELRLKLEI